MPCNQVRRTTVSIEAANDGLLAKALVAMGAGNVAIIGKGHIEFLEGNRLSWIKDGKAFVLTGGAFSDVNAIKVAYSRETVRAAASRFGQTLKPAAVVTVRR